MSGAEIVLLVFYFLILLYSIILHEISHGIAALRMGDLTAKLAGRLTLHPKSHIDPLGSIILPIAMWFSAGFAFGWAKPVPFNPHNLKYKIWGSALVALAGPATNFGLALMFALIARVLPLAQGDKAVILSDLMSRNFEAMLADVSGSVPAILFLFCVMAIFWNVLLGVFNLIPIPPLDGSKVLFTIVPIDEITRMRLEQWGFFIVLAFIFIFSHQFYLLLSFFWDIFFNITI